jgi:predicted transcriptional regulator
MAIKRKEAFEPELVEIAEFARAIAHPARLAILKILSERDTCICGEIVEVLPLAQATVSQHLLALKKAGLIKGTISGVKSCYCIHRENWNRMQNGMNVFQSHITQSLVSINNQCC